MLKSRELWTIQPTTAERKAGRLMRGPDPDPEPTPTLVTEPPVDGGPATPVPADPNAAPAPPPVEPAKPVEPPAPPAEPLTVENLTLPEGLELPPELGNKFVEILNGEMEPKDRANALIALHGETIRNALEADSKAWDTMQTEWRDAAKADTDIGGDKLQPTIANVRKLLDEFGNKDVSEVFDFTGAGNNVHMIKFLNTLADKLTEGNFFKAGQPSSLENDPNAGAKRMFPSMKG